MQKALVVLSKLKYHSPDNRRLKKLQTSWPLKINQKTISSYFHIFCNLKSFSFAMNIADCIIYVRQKAKQYENCWKLKHCEQEKKELQPLITAEGGEVRFDFPTLRKKNILKVHHRKS